MSCLFGNLIILRYVYLLLYLYLVYASIVHSKGTFCIAYFSFYMNLSVHFLIMDDYPYL